MTDWKDREAEPWSDIAKPTPRFNYKALGTDAYEEGLELRRQERMLARIREAEPDYSFMTGRPNDFEC